MIFKRLGLKAVSCVTAFVFLWVNCVWAGPVQNVVHTPLSGETLALWSQAEEVLSEMRVRCYGAVTLETLVKMEIADQETLHKMWYEIRRELGERIGPAVDELRILVLDGERKGEMEGGAVIYTFHPEEGYLFSRRTTVAGADDPLNRLIRNRLPNHTGTVDPNVNALIDLITSRLEIRLRGPDGRFVKKPGGSPEDILKTIADHPEFQALILEWGFTIKDYREYDDRVSESTNRRDLRELVSQGYLQRDETEVPYKFWLTDKGIEEIERLRTMGEIEPAREIAREDYYRESLRNDDIDIGDRIYAYNQLEEMGRLSNTDREIFYKIYLSDEKFMVRQRRIAELVGAEDPSAIPELVKALERCKEGFYKRGPNWKRFRDEGLFVVGSILLCGGPHAVEIFGGILNEKVVIDRSILDSVSTVLDVASFIPQFAVEAGLLKQVLSVLDPSLELYLLEKYTFYHSKFRCAVVQMLGEIETKEALQVLTDFLERQVHAETVFQLVGESVASTIRNLPEWFAVGTAKKVLRDVIVNGRKVPFIDIVKERATDQTSEVPSRVVEGTVLSTVKEISLVRADEWAAIEAIKILGNQHYQPAREVLERALKDRRIRVSQAARRALGRFGALTTEVKAETFRSIEPTNREDILSLRDSDTRESIIKDIVEIGRPMVSSLIPFLEDDNSGIRLLILEILGKLGPAAGEAVPAIIKVLKDHIPWIRIAAVETLGEIGSAAREAVPSLIEHLDQYDTSKSVVETVVETLIKLGEPAVSDLNEALEHDNQVVREAAQEALENIIESEGSQPVQEWKEKLYSRMRDEAGVYTAVEVARELNISEQEAERMLDWLSSIDREIEPDGKFRGIEKITRQGKTIYQWLNPSSINPDIFRDYDFRSNTFGSVDFSPKRFFFMTLAWIHMAKEKAEGLGIDNRKVLIARDCRKTDHGMAEAVIRAVEHSGLQAIYIGRNPNTAASYAWAVRKHAPLLGIFLTASHLKAEDAMGAKVSIRGRSEELESLTTQEIKQVSRKLLDRILRDPNRLDLISREPVPRMFDDVERTYIQMATLVNLVAMGMFKPGVETRSLYELGADLKSAGDVLAVLKKYEDIVDREAKPFSGLKVVVEAAHTPSGKLAAGVYRALGAEVIVLHEDVKELTGQHKADPSNIDNLKDLMDKMEETGAHFGVAFDLDGDRGSVVVPTKEKGFVTKRKFTVVSPGDLTQSLLPFFDKRGYSVSERGKVAVVRDVVSTRGVDKKARELGYEPYKTDAGYTFVKQKREQLEEQGYTVPICAEGVGHSFTHVAGAFEDPIMVSLFFAVMGKEHMDRNVNETHPFIEVLSENTVSYMQSVRFQPLFGELLLKQLSSDPENTTGWTTEKGKPPTAVIALGRRKVISVLANDFKEGSEFDTPAGKLKVSELDVYKKPGTDIPRYAEIRFTLNGRDAGSFVFRASSNDPTWVCIFEVPLGEGETFKSESLQVRYDSVGGVVLDYLETKGYARVAGEGLEYNNKEYVEGALLRYRGADETKGSHLARDLGRRRWGNVWSVMNSIDELKDYNEAAKEMLDRLEHIYGSGIFIRIKEIQIVENIKGGRLYPTGRAPLAGYENGVLKIDELLFKLNKWVLFEQLEHELLESIGDVVPGSKRMFSDIVATLRNVLRFLDPNSGVTDEKYRVDVWEYRHYILSVNEEDRTVDPDRKYKKLLTGLLRLQEEGELSHDFIIACVVSYTMRSKLYRTVKTELGLGGWAESDLVTHLRRLSLLFDDALSVFDVITSAAKGKELIEQVKESGDITVKAVKTFTGLRIEGISGLSKRLQEMIGVTAKQVYNTDRLAGQVTRATETKYILLDSGRLEELKAVIGEDEYWRVEKTLRDNNYQICTEMPMGVALGNVIRLVDPVDLENMPKVNGMLYLPMPYTRSSLYMAANIVEAGGVVRDIDSLVKGFLLGLYSQITGGSVSDRDLLKLFTRPWDFLPEICKVIDDLNSLRKAAFMIDEAA